MKKNLLYAILFLFLWINHSRPSNDNVSGWWNPSGWINQAKNRLTNSRKKKRIKRMRKGEPIFPVFLLLNMDKNW